MKNLIKILFATALLSSIFATQSAMSDEYPKKEGARDEYSNHPHFTLSESTGQNDATHKERENYMMHMMRKHIDDETSLDEELFPDPEH